LYSSYLRKNAQSGFYLRNGFYFILAFFGQDQPAFARLATAGQAGFSGYFFHAFLMKAWKPQSPVAKNNTIP
jgi:hypothetical protein